MTTLPNSEWPALRELARVAWTRIVLRDLKRTQTQMEELHRKEDITEERFESICEFDRRQTGWYFCAFGGKCPERAVYDAYWDGVLSDEDFSDASPVLIDARDGYIAKHWEPDSMVQMDTPLSEAVKRNERSLYVD